MGKTALLSSWVAARGLSCLWWQVAVQDSDLPTFLRAFAPACEDFAPSWSAWADRFDFAVADTAKSRRGAGAVPVSQMRQAAADAAARLVEACRDRSETPSVWVFDALEALSADAAAVTFLSALVRGFAGRVIVAMGSRAAPPQEVQELLALRRAPVLYKQELLLTRGEGLAVSRALGLSDEVAERHYAATRGWAAPLVLLAHAEPATAALNAADCRSDAIHAYLERNVLCGLAESQRHFLETLAVLPVVTRSLLRGVCSAPEAVGWLDRLAVDHLFVEPPVAGGAAFRMHPLVRQCLLRTLEQRLPPSELAHLRAQAAVAVGDCGLMREAASLWAESEDWLRLADFLRECARRWIAAGRGAEVAQLIGAVPASVLKNQPWLLFWLGSALASDSRPEEALAHYSAALALFEARREADGAYLAWAGAVGTFFLKWDEGFKLDAWIGRYAALERAFGPPRKPEVEIPVLRAGLSFFVFRPDHPLVIGWIERARSLVDRVGAPGERLALAFALVLVHNWQGVLFDARYVLQRVDVDDEAARSSPVEYLYLCAWGASALWKAVDHDAAFALLAAGRAFADALGFHRCDFQLAAQEAFCALNRGDLARADAALESARSLVRSGHRLEQGEYLLLEATRALMDEDGHAVREFVERLTQSFLAWAPWPTHNALLTLAQGYNVLKMYGEAEDCLLRCIEFARSMPSPLLQFSAGLTLAWTYLEQGRRSDALAALREVLRTGSREGYFNTAPAWLPKPFARVLAVALEEGIETDYVRALIRRRDLTAPRIDVPSWPWPVRIETLGRFDVQVEGQLIATPGKSQRRPLDLLRCLVALGGEDVPVSVLIDALWPEEEGDRARHAFDMALSRLRRLLGNARALTLGVGRLSLDPGVCWVDTRAFESLVRRGLSAEDREEGEVTLQRAVELYRGEFLEGEAPQPWLMATRERLARRYLEAALKLAERLMARGEPREALGLLEALIDRHPRSEAPLPDADAGLSACGRPSPGAGHLLAMSSHAGRAFWGRAGEYHTRLEAPGERRFVTGI